jgi:hypothetical protein
VVNIREAAVKRAKLIRNEREEQASIVAAAPRDGTAGAVAGGAKPRRFTVLKKGRRKAGLFAACLFAATHGPCLFIFPSGSKALLVRSLDRMP